MRVLRPWATGLTALLLANCGEAPFAEDAFASRAEAVATLQDLRDNTSISTKLGQIRSPAQTPGTGVIHPLGHDDLCLDVVWGNNRDGTPVQISKCNGNDAQKWTFINGMVKIYGDKCLNVSDGGQADGTRLQIWTCSGDTTEDYNNMWEVSGNTLRWQKDRSKCLDVVSNNISNGTAVQIWRCIGAAGKANQRWTWPTGGSKAAAKPATSSNAGAATTPSKPSTSTSSTSNGSKSVAPKFQAGIHIDYDNANGNTGGVAGFVKRTGIKPALVANYVRVKKDGSFETNTAKWYADDAAANGAKIISYAITAESSSFSQSQLQGIKDAITYAKGKGLAVELRFGYEMNGYWSPSYHDNNPSVFKSMWAKLAPVAKANGAYMVWCPNVAGNAPDTYRPWLPADLTSIDKIGLDYYVELTSSQPTLAQAQKIIGGIYPIVSQVNQAHQKAKTGREVPFTFGETAVNIRDDRNNWGKSVNNETQLKKSWLEALSEPSLRTQYPLYRGFTWFDYYKSELSGGTTGTRYNNAFEVSQDPQSAAVFKAWYNKHVQ